MNMPAPLPESRFDEESTLTVGHLTVFLAKRTAQMHDRRIPLSRRESSLLRTFMSEPDRVFTREELCRIVWRRRHTRATKLVEVSIGRLRRKMGAGLIQTVRSLGYTLQAEA